MTGGWTDEGINKLLMCCKNEVNILNHVGLYDGDLCFCYFSWCIHGVMMCADVVVSNATQVGSNWSADWVWRHVSVYWWPCRLASCKCIQVIYVFEVVCLSQYLTRRLAGKSISKITYFVSSGMLNFNSVSQLCVCLHVPIPKPFCCYHQCYCYYYTINHAYTCTGNNKKISLYISVMLQHQISHHIIAVILSCQIKRRRLCAKIRLLGIIPWAPTHAYANRRWGSPARIQHNSVLRQKVVFMRTWELINCGKAGNFWSLTYWQAEQVN